MKKISSPASVVYSVVVYTILMLIMVVLLFLNDATRHSHPLHYYLTGALALVYIYYMSVVVPARYRKLTHPKAGEKQKAISGRFLRSRQISKG